MIVPDVNLLVFAYHEDDPNHEAARRWWEELINGVETIGVPWSVTNGIRAPVIESQDTCVSIVAISGH